jgi:hypothetical protein
VKWWPGVGGLRLMGMRETSHRAEPHRFFHRLTSHASPSRQHAEQWVNASLRTFEGLKAPRLPSGWRIRHIAMRQCDSERHFFALSSPWIILVFFAILVGRVLSVDDGLSHAPVWLIETGCDSERVRLRCVTRNCGRDT